MYGGAGQTPPEQVQKSHFFVEKLHKECGPSPAALLTACQDLKGQMELAGVDDDQKFSISGFSDDLLLCLADEKKSVEDMLIYLDELAIAFQNQMEELKRKKEGTGGEEAEKEEKFEDTRDTGSITSLTSKTQHAALDSRAGKATNAFPHPPGGEGGQQVDAAVGHGNG